MRRASSGAIALIVLGCAIALGAPAQATSDASDTQPPKSNETTKENTNVFVVAPSKATEASRDSAVFFPTGQIGDDTLVVMPDFYESLGLTYADVSQANSRAELARVLDSANIGAAKITCGGQVVGIYGTWSRAVASSCATFGSPNYYQHYTWWVQANTNQNAAAQGPGYYKGYSGTTMGVWQKWYGLGVGKSGAASVPWGNVLANAKVRVQSTIAVHVANVTWTNP